MILQRFITVDLICVRPKRTQAATDLDTGTDPKVEGPFDPEIERFFASSDEDDDFSDWKTSGRFDEDFLDASADEQALPPVGPSSPVRRGAGEKRGERAPRAKAAKSGGSAKARGLAKSMKKGAAKSKKKNAVKRPRGSKPKRSGAALSQFPPFTAEEKRWYNIDLRGPSWRTLRAMELLAISPCHPELRDQPRRGISKECRAFIVDAKVQWLNLRWRRLWRGRLTGVDLDQFNDFLAAVRIQDQPAMRLRIEAGIIADVSQHHIATATNLPIGVIEKFEDYVFDVRNRVAVRQELLERFLPAEYTDEEKQFSQFILLTARNAGVYAYHELVQAIDQLGLTHDLLTEEGRKAERSEILYELFKYRRAGLPEKSLIHLLPKRTNRSVPADALFQDLPRYQSSGGAIRKTAEFGFDRFAEQIKAMPQGIDRLPRVMGPQPVAATEPVASPQPLAPAEPLAPTEPLAPPELPVIEGAEPSPAAAKTEKRSGQDRGDDAAIGRKRA